MAASVGYRALLRHNQAFRRLWYGQIVSELGDWLDSIALYTLLLQLTDSGQALGFLLVLQTIPPTIVGLGAGVVVDRFPRRLVMIAVDLARAPLVLLYLLVRGPEDIWLLYLIVALKYSLTAFFEPARSALVPVITKREDLVAANNIASTTWSAMLALGTAVGGLVAGLLGPEMAFILDAASFVVSAALIYSMRVKEPPVVVAQDSTGWREFQQGIAYLADHRDVALYTFVKTLWGLVGGIALAFTLLAHEVFPIGVNGAISIGLIYAARGIGAGIGPLVAERLGDHSIAYLRRALGPAFLLGGLGYLAAGAAPTLPLVLIAAGLGSMGGSTQWVFSTTLIQMSAPRLYMGRVFAVEGAGFTLALALSSYTVGVLHDAGWGPRALILALAGLAIVLAALLTLILRTTNAATPQLEMHESSST